jgi:hypothetical protein
VSLRDLRRAAWEREGGRCAVTGASVGDVDGDGYHLLPRVHNFGRASLVVDGVAGRSVHGDIPWAKARGLLLSSHENNPGAVPAWMWNVNGGHAWWLLSDDGCVQWVDAPPPAP